MAIDAVLAEQARHYRPLSTANTAAAIGAIIEAHDPAALRRARQHPRCRDVVTEHRNTEEATTALWPRLYAHHAKAPDRRLSAIAHTVCDHDPRTIAQRRADAPGALAAGGQMLAYSCGSDDCPAGTDRAASSILIHMVARADRIGTSADRHHDGEEPPAPPVDPANRRQHGRTLMMATRRRTRTQNRDHAIKAERAQPSKPPPYATPIVSTDTTARVRTTV